MAHAMPVVSTSHSGIPELIFDGVNGLLAKAGDTNSLVEKIEYIISNPRRSAEMASEGQKFIKTNHDIDKLNEELISFFEKKIDN
jgi:colanic acid/amylovoran/stewartan biosynthesis glycosyltransferase WcaL/AmsK/CpsK